jgi:beta-1,2-mannosidase
MLMTVPKSTCLGGVLLAVCSYAAGQVAGSWQLGPFTRLSQEPLVRPSDATFTDPLTGKQVSWEKLHTFNPAAIVRDGKVCVLYRAEDDSGAMGIGGHTSRIGLAESDDGVHFTRFPAPVFYPADDEQRSREAEGGTEDPRIVESQDGTYVMTYTQWSRLTHTYRTGVATSRDLHTWVKHGPIFAGVANGKYDHFAYKSAGIVTRLEGDRLLAAKIDGHYWMYWGEIEIRLATSHDLIHWTPVESADGQPMVVMRARAGKFDSAFPEVGPPPLLTSRGIVVIYNAKNAEADKAKNAKDDKTGHGEGAGDPNLTPGTYTVGEALFDAKNPVKLLARTEEPVLGPSLAWESSGQYKAGTTFAEGLAWFKGRWLLYYGAADSFVGGAATSVAPVPAMDRH